MVISAIFAVWKVCLCTLYMYPHTPTYASNYICMWHCTIEQNPQTCLQLKTMTNRCCWDCVFYSNNRVNVSVETWKRQMIKDVVLLYVPSIHKIINFLEPKRREKKLNQRSVVYKWQLTTAKTWTHMNRNRFIITERMKERESERTIYEKSTKKIWDPPNQMKWKQKHHQQHKEKKNNNYDFSLVSHACMCMCVFVCRSPFFSLHLNRWMGLIFSNSDSKCV